MSAAAYRQHCQNIVDTHRPARTWRTLWLQRRCTCGAPWTELDDVVGCWLVRGAVAELAGVPDNRPAAHRRRADGPLSKSATVRIDPWGLR
jgi:hypothetical protein